jgi:DNA-binding FadR family transcriptional regulator
LVEVEFARLAARNRTEEQLGEMRSILAEEESADVSDYELITQIDFRFHHLIAMATDNIFYPLLLNSFKDLYLNGALLFFSDSSLTQQVFDFHTQLVDSIAAHDEQAAIVVMQEMLKHGKDNYLKMVPT